MKKYIFICLLLICCYGYITECETYISKYLNGNLLYDDINKYKFTLLYSGKNLNSVGS